MKFPTAIGEGKAATAVVNHVGEIRIIKLICSRVVWVTGHLRSEITPIDTIPALIEKYKGFCRSRGSQVSGLEEQPVIRHGGHTPCGCRVAAKKNVHGHAADARLWVSI